MKRASNENVRQKQTFKYVENKTEHHLFQENLKIYRTRWHIGMTSFLYAADPGSISGKRKGEFFQLDLHLLFRFYGCVGYENDTKEMLMRANQNDCNYLVCSFYSLSIKHRAHYFVVYFFG